MNEFCCHYTMRAEGPKTVLNSALFAMTLKFLACPASQALFKICYTLRMQSQTAWSQWAESLRRLKMDGLVAWFLEAGGPLTLLGAQAVYMSQPFLGGKRWDALAHMLEEEEEARAFARYLRGESPG